MLVKHDDKGKNACAEMKTMVKYFKFDADIAQLVEQLICNQQVAGSSPIVG